MDQHKVSDSFDSNTFNLADSGQLPKVQHLQPVSLADFQSNTSTPF